MRMDFHLPPSAPVPGPFLSSILNAPNHLQSLPFSLSIVPQQRSLIFISSLITCPIQVTFFFGIVFENDLVSFILARTSLQLILSILFSPSYGNTLDQSLLQSFQIHTVAKQYHLIIKCSIAMTIVTLINCDQSCESRQNIRNNTIIKSRIILALVHTLTNTVFGEFPAH